MVDVTDRMASLPRSRGGVLGREGSSSGGFPNMSELKVTLQEVEPLKGSSSFSPKDVDDIMQTTAKIVGDTNVDWIKRMNMLKTFRSLCSDPNHHPQILAYLRQLMPPMQSAVKDLRSQVCREACLTVAFLSNQLGVKCEFFMEPLMPALFSLLGANAKVVSLNGASTIMMVYETVPSFRLIPPLTVQMQSKSKESRRAVVSALKFILHCWPSAPVQRQAHLIHDIMRKGLTDADPEVRTISRDNFVAFQRVFPGLSNSILDSLDPPQKKQIIALIKNQQESSSQLQQTPATPVQLQSRTNGSAHHHSLPHHPHPPPLSNSHSLSRQSSMTKKTSIPVLASRISPAKSPSVGGARSSSAIDLQAASRAKQHHFSSSTLTRSPLKFMGRTNSMATPVHGVLQPVNNYNFTNNNSNQSPHYLPGSPGGGSGSGGGIPPGERSRNRSRISRLSHSQPGSRSNSPSSKFLYNTYMSPYSQNSHDGSPLSLVSPPSGLSSRGVRRFSATSSASSSRDTSPQRSKLGIGPLGQGLGHRGRGLNVTAPQIPLNPNSASAKMLLASREAETVLADALKHRDSMDGNDYGNHSDSEDSLGSHRSFLSETFSPPNAGRHFFHEEKVEDLLNKCGSAKWSERKEGLLGLQTYLQRHGSIPSQHFNRIGQTFCRIFMDAHTKVLSLFLDVLHAVLYRHAKDLVDFTTILLNRVLTKVGSDLLTSVHTKLLKTLEIIMEEMPTDLQFSAVAHYLCDPTQTPNSRSRVAALAHLYNLSTFPINIKVDELQCLVEKILDWCGDMRSQDLRKMSQKVFYALFDMAAPQMTLVLGQMAPHKQDQAKAILKNAQESRNSLPFSSSDQNRHGPISHYQVGVGGGLTMSEDRLGLGIDTSGVGGGGGGGGGGWNSINNDIQALRIQSNESEANDMVSILSQLSLSSGSKKSELILILFKSIKEADDEHLIENHKEVLKVVFDALTNVSRTSDKALCFGCLEEMCLRKVLAPMLAAFAELFIVRVTDVVDKPETPREVTKAAESCGMALASNFPPETLVRALCPIVQNRDYPVNQMAIKMLQRLSECCEMGKLKALVPDVMNTLIGAYDHPDSAVRKAAVFAIVSIYLRMGSELEPYLKALSGSKLKLLQLYIQRAQQQNNVSLNS